MQNHILSGKTALVTGASSGMGADFARHLASYGCNVILVARREDRLRALQKEVAGRYAVAVDVVPLDLLAQDAPQVLYDRVKAAGHSVDVLINNAGLGIYGEFLDIPWEREKAMLELDIIAVVHMTKLFVKDMVGRDFGFVLQVASIGAFQPTPTYATYSAAKTFVLYFGEALKFELRNTKVKCCVLCPGVTRTEFFEVAGQKPNLYQRTVMMDSDKAVKIGLEAMLKGRASVVPGLLNAFLAWFTRLVPRQMSAATSSRLMTLK